METAWFASQISIFPICVKASVCEAENTHNGNFCFIFRWIQTPVNCLHEGCPEGRPTVYILLWCTALLVEKAGVAPDVTRRFTMHKQVSVLARDPPWLWNPWGESQEVQNRGNQWPHIMDLGPTKIKKEHLSTEGFSKGVCLTGLLAQAYLNTINLHFGCVQTQSYDTYRNKLHNCALYMQKDTYISPNNSVKICLCQWASEAHSFRKNLIVAIRAIHFLKLSLCSHFN